MQVMAAGVKMHFSQLFHARICTSCNKYCANNYQKFFWDWPDMEYVRKSWLVNQKPCGCFCLSEWLIVRLQVAQ